MSLLNESVINVCCIFPRCRILREQRRGEKSLCENTVSKRLHAQQNPSEAQEEKREPQSAEPPKSVDDSTLKSRSKRESRRQRELQQASFSLELLKVRSGSVDDAQIPLPSDSQESFEILGFPDEEPAASELRPQSEPEPMEENQSSLASFKPHFYIADEDSSPVKQAREKEESVVVIIRMQKENPVDQSSLEALQKLEMMDTEEIHRETDDRPNGLSSPDHPEPQTITSSSSKPLQLDLRDSVREVASEPKKEVQKKFVSQSISISMKEKAFSPKRSRLTFSKWVHVKIRDVTIHSTHDSILAWFILFFYKMRLYSKWKVVLLLGYCCMFLCEIDI